jgi:multidrug efflux pump subunit AcrA (membrane-fusion protein)
MISNDGFGVEVDLPEIDSIKVRSGNPVAIELEAVPGELFEGVIASVNRTETIIDGVSVYEARIAFTDSDDERIVSGMTADVAITTDTREDVLVLPARAIRYRVDGSTYVLVGTDAKDPQEVDVVTGLRGSDGYTEILGGLNEGDNVIVG